MLWLLCRWLLPGLSDVGLTCFVCFPYTDRLSEFANQFSLLDSTMDILLKRELELAIKSHLDSQCQDNQFAVSLKLEENAVIDEITCKGLDPITIPAGLNVSLMGLQSQLDL